MPAHLTPAVLATPSTFSPGWRLPLRQFFALFVLALAVTRGHLVHARSIADGGNGWMIGDWFINYADGFVRRGLFGELFLALGPSGPTGLWALFWLQACLYAGLAAYLVAVLFRCRFSWSSIALVCGPAGVAFIGWDANGGFRKELLVFATLLLLALARWAAERQRLSVGLTLLAVPTYLLAVFSWEPAALLVPALAYLLLSRPVPGRVIVARSVFALLAVVGFVGGGMSVMSRGDPATAVRVCREVRAQGFLGPGLCGQVDQGGIDALGWTPAQALGKVAAAFPLYAGFLPLIALAFLPIVLSRWFGRNWPWVVAICVAFLPMYLLAPHYGRWTHILVLTLTLCMTAHDPDDVTSNVWNPALGVMYVALWGLPYYLLPDSTQFPWMGMANTLVVSGMQWAAHLMGIPANPVNAVVP